ncbi:hypothetical protein [Blastococcus sp. SYSU DS0533]
MKDIAVRKDEGGLRGRAATAERAPSCNWKPVLVSTWWGKETSFMKHRHRKAINARGLSIGPSGEPSPWWVTPWQFSVSAVVMVYVTYSTGSVTDGILAVSAVAAAAHGMPRRGSSQPPMIA